MPGHVESCVRHLVEEIDAYLATLHGPGVAEVRAVLAQWQGAALVEPVATATQLPHDLDQALGLLSADGHPSLAQAIAQASPYLKWITYDRYPLESIGAAFANSHSYCSVVGKQGPVQAKDFDLGLFIIKPHTLYRDHHHPAPELYAPLTGPQGWRFAKDEPLSWKAAHETVWNPPLQHHATLTGPNPFSCIFGWTRDVQASAHVIGCDDWAALEQQSPPLMAVR